MGLVLGLAIGFLAVFGIAHQEVLADKSMKQEIQKPAIKTLPKSPKSSRSKPSIARLDGLEIRNLKG